MRVTSRDGTEIACCTNGDGPLLLLVHGAISDHARWSPLLPHLEPHATVHVADLLAHELFARPLVAFLRGAS